MRKRSFSKMLLNCFSCSSSCFFCINNSDTHKEEDDELSGRISLVKSDHGGRTTESAAVLLKDVLYDRNDMQTTLAFQLKPQTVILRVSMHCHGCAKKVQKHISKMDGVTSYKVDLESKLVIIVGHIFPVEVLQSVSKIIKYTELWNPSIDNSDSDDFTAYF